MKIKPFIFGRICAAFSLALLLASCGTGSSPPSVVAEPAQATPTKSTFPFSLSFPDTNPCTGGPVTITISGEAQIHVVSDATGKLHRTFMLRAVMTETSSAGQVSGTIEWNRSYDSERETFVIVGRIVQPGSRNNVVIHLLTHVRPNGVSFDKGGIECH